MSYKTELQSNNNDLNTILATINNLPTAISIDDTLTQAGMAADAKVVGEALDAQSDYLEEQIHSNIASLSDVFTSALETACKIQTGSYKGNGKSSIGNEVSLTFAFQPKLVIIHWEGNTYGAVVMMQGISHARVQTGSISTIEWSGNSVSWWATDVGMHMNVADGVYKWVAIGSEGGITHEYH